ncbi:unnamed protein product [Linum trigynum]|uniref:Uncharacterized protein n=1 Tax=Linum trigynum TaxID=586398 RepID=A0AAV2EG51_9ROSI
MGRASATNLVVLFLLAVATNIAVAKMLDDSDVAVQSLPDSTSIPSNAASAAATAAKGLAAAGNDEAMAAPDGGGDLGGSYADETVPKSKGTSQLSRKLGGDGGYGYGNGNIGN